MSFQEKLTIVFDKIKEKKNNIIKETKSGTGVKEFYLFKKEEVDEGNWEIIKKKITDNE